MAGEWKISAEYVDEIMRMSEFIELDCFGNCTVVVMKLPNGFVLCEKSGTIDPSDYDPDTGRKICREKLRNKVWELEGYVRKSIWARKASLAAEHESKDEAGSRAPAI